MLVGLGWMARDRQGVLGMVVAVHVRDMETGFADRRFQGHDRTVTDAAWPIAAVTVKMRESPTRCHLE